MIRLRRYLLRLVPVLALGCTRHCPVEFDLIRVLERATGRVKRVELKCRDDLIATGSGLRHADAPEP